MKKKVLIVVMMFAVFITNFLVSRTYAKYISKIDLTDEARVAKWGLSDEEKTIDLFADSYSVNGKGVYVKSLNCKTVDGNEVCDNVVAPGTTGSYDLNISGTMETRYTLNIDLKNENDFVVYYKVDGNNKVTEMKTASELTNEAGELVTTGYTEYHPLRYTITKGNNEALAIPVNNVTFADLKKALNTYNSSNNYEPGVLNKNYKLTWTWATQNKDLDGDEIDKLDTYAGQHLSEEGDTVKFKVSVTATQVAEDYAKAN